MFVELVYISGIGLALYILYKWLTSKGDYFAKRKIPYLKPNFPFGNTSGFMFLKKYSGPGFITMMYNKFPGEKLFGFFDLLQPIYLIREPNIIKQLTIKDFDHFEDHNAGIDENSDSMLFHTLVFLRGKKWRDMRATLSPAFTGSKMRQMFELVSECADDMTKYFIAQAEKGVQLNYEMKDLFSKYTNDVIASCAFGIKVNSFENDKNEFLLTGRQFLNFSRPKAILKLLFIVAMPKLLRSLGIEFIDENIKQFFRSMVLNNMEQREKKNIYRPDMINMLMQVRKGAAQGATASDEKSEENAKTIDGFATAEESEIGKVSSRKVWSDDEIVAQCFLFFIAGFDTSSTLLTFVAYELAINPDIQEKLYNEVVETNRSMHNAPLTYDVLQKMKYMDQVISETLRMWPPAFVTDRLCTKDYTFRDEDGKDYQFGKGSSFWVPIYALQRDPKYFPEPEKFDPERFNDDYRDNIINGTYIPFGVGPRNCIGSRFALMEVKAVFYYLLLNFIIQPNANTQIPVQLKKGPANTSPEKGVQLEFKLRSK